MNAAIRRLTEEPKFWGACGPLALAGVRPTMWLFLYNAAPRAVSRGCWSRIRASREFMSLEVMKGERRGAHTL